jgi:hypothetical protein
MTAWDVDRAIARLAKRQHGAFARRQVLALGGTDRMISRRTLTGRWVRLAHGVYALSDHPATWSRTLMAAVLGEPRAAIGGSAAAALHGLSGFRPGRVTIVVPPGSNHRSSVAVVRERADMRSTVVDGIPVLTVCDTLFEVARASTGTMLTRALDDALSRGVVTVEELQARYLDLRPRRQRGLGLMRRLIAVRGDGYVSPASELEGRLYAVLDRPGMPAYVRQARLPWAPDQRVDALLVEAQVIVEADGRRWHSRVDDFERDRARDRAAAVHGHRTLRYTWIDLTCAADRVAHEVRSIARAAA